MGLGFRKRRKFAMDLKIANELGNEVMDENEKYALFKCASYLRNILSVRPIFDEETVRILLWILKGDAGYLLEFLNDCITDKSESKRINEIAIKKMMFDPNECVEFIDKTIRLLEKKNFNKLQLFICDLLEKRKQNLPCKGASNIEKKLSAFKKMFKLTDAEFEFSILLMINTLWEVANSYFVDHLKCQSFVNRKYLTSML